MPRDPLLIRVNLILPVGLLLFCVFTGFGREVMSGKEALAAQGSAMPDPPHLRYELESVYQRFIHSLKDKDLDAFLGVVEFPAGVTAEYRFRKTIETNFGKYAEWLLTLNPELAATDFVTIKTEGPRVSGYCFIWRPPLSRVSIHEFRAGEPCTQETAPDDKWGSLVSMRTFVKSKKGWKLLLDRPLDRKDGVELLRPATHKRIDGRTVGEYISDADPIAEAQYLAGSFFEFDLYEIEEKYGVKIWKKLREAVPHVIVAILVLGPLLVGIASYMDLRTAKKTAFWPTAPGTITTLDSAGNFAFEYRYGLRIYRSEYFSYGEWVAAHREEASSKESPAAYSPYGKYARVPARTDRIWFKSLHSFDAPRRQAVISRRQTLQKEKDRALRIALHYTEGDKVQVSHHPDNPEIAILEPYSAGAHVDPSSFAGPLFAVIMWLTFLAIACASYWVPRLAGWPTWTTGVGGVLVALVGLPAIGIAAVTIYSARFGTGAPPSPDSQPELSDPHAEHAEAWPATDGQIFLSYIGSYPVRNHDVPVPRILYKYKVGRKVYSAIFHAGETAYKTRKSELDTPEKMLGRFPEGEEVIVRYNPESPDMSTLER